MTVKEIEAGAGSPRIGLCFYPIMGLTENHCNHAAIVLAETI
jgi:hypothetical protein